MQPDAVAGNHAAQAGKLIPGGVEGRDAKINLIIKCAGAEPVSEPCLGVNGRAAVNVQGREAGGDEINFLAHDGIAARAEAAVKKARAAVGRPFAVGADESGWNTSQRLPSVELLLEVAVELEGLPEARACGRP